MPMRTFKDIIQRWKTAEELAKELGEKGVTVRQWGNRNSIPPEKWLPLIEAAERAGHPEITLELLASIARAGGMLEAA